MRLLPGFSPGANLHFNYTKQEVNLKAPSSDPIAALEILVSSSTSGFLNLHWLLQSLDVLVSSHTQLQSELLLRPALDSGFVSAFMDDTRRLMEACNVVKLGISEAGRSRIHVKYVIRSLVEQRGDSEVRKLIRECISEMEMGPHTGSDWPLLDQELSSKAAKLSKSKMKPRIASKASEAKLVSVLVLTALFAAFSGDRGLNLPSQNGALLKKLAPGTPARRLLEGIKQEAEVLTKPVASVLQPVCSTLKQILAMLESEDGWDDSEEQRKLKMKPLVQQLSKKLEYLESGLGIVEEQLQQLFAKLVGNRNLILTTSTM